MIFTVTREIPDVNIAAFIKIRRSPLLRFPIKNVLIIAEKHIATASDLGY